MFFEGLYQAKSRKQPGFNLRQHQAPHIVAQRGQRLRPQTGLMLSLGDDQPVLRNSKFKPFSQQPGNGAKQAPVICCKWFVKGAIKCA